MSADYVADPAIGLDLIPAVASRFASDSDTLFFVLVGLSVLLLAVVVGLVAGFGFRYRASRDFERGPIASELTAHRMELAGVALLAVLFAVTFVWASTLFLDVYRGPASATSIEVMGKQWMWKVEHPDGTREINTLHVPTGETIRLHITSQDVIHSFYVPALRLKRDAVPGRYNDAWFTATKPGVYRLFCAEYCGTDHSRMRGRVVVQTPADYQRWLTRSGHSAGPPGRGKQLFQTYGCSGCHLGKSSVKAPSLAGIYGRRIPLASGETVVADAAYLRDSIRRPGSQVAAGYVPIMPPFPTMPESDLQAIVAYLQSLEPGDWERGPATQNPGGGQ